MKRREFVGVLAAGVAWPLAGRAQQGRLRPLIGWLGGSSSQVGARNHEAFLQGLRTYGLADGKTIDIVTRWADGDTARLSPLAKEMIALRPDAILSASGAGNVALMQATAAIPIVGALTIEPIKLGLAVSYNHPGRNFTGVLLTVDGLASKQAELLLEVVPRASVVGVLTNPDNPTHPGLVREIETALRGRSIGVVPAAARRPDELHSAFETFQQRKADGIIVLTDNLSFTSASQIISLAQANRLPAILDRREHVTKGALISYGVAIRENFRRAGFFINRILKGTKPGDLPIEFPTKIELAVNLRTAHELGLTVPTELLASADEVIE